MKPVIQRAKGSNPCRPPASKIKERMLVELLRKSASMPFDYYKEIIASYRRIAEELDIRQIEDCIALYDRSCAESIFVKLQLEVF